MTTNQKIDGVPRELLELLMRDLNGGGQQLTGTEHMRAYRELHALLDAPENVQRWVTVEAFIRVCDELEGFKAAQPHGEPVAWIKPDVAKTLSRDECCYAFGSQNPKGTLIPLYAEQPAPVAVVLTDAQILEAMRQPLNDADGGYVVDTAPGNVVAAGRALIARLDEVTSLNDPRTPFEIEHDAEPGDEAAFRKWREDRQNNK